MRMNRSKVFVRRPCGTASLAVVSPVSWRHSASLVALAMSALAASQTPACAQATWDGSASQDWSDAANWSTNAVPTGSVDVTIPHGTPNAPVIDGEAVTAKTLTLGNFSGLAKLDIVNGGTLATNGGILGYDASAQGLLTLSGVGSSWTDTSSLQIGQAGEALVKVSAGGLFKTNSVNLGVIADSSGVVEVDGAGTIWNNTNTLFIGKGGSGGVDVTNGGQVTSGTIRIADLATSTYSTLTIDGAGSSVSTNTLWIGMQGNAEISVTNGGALSNGYAELAHEAGAEGYVVVKGSGSTWSNSNGLVIGSAGRGILEITDGGQVSSTYSSLAAEIGSFAEASVIGAGANWTNSQNLTVGVRGEANLNIEAHGVVTNQNGRIGSEAGSQGRVYVYGAGSQWINSGYLFVGMAGSGYLDIGTGGYVSSDGGSISGSQDSVGSVTVGGTGSKWLNSGSMIVGEFGEGSLDISGGGEVSNTIGMVGRNTAAKGTVTVQGAGSLWSNTSHLYIGESGTGTVVLSKAGKITVGGNIIIASAQGSTGTFVIGAQSGNPVAAGSLTAGRIQFGNGDGKLIFNHTDTNYLFDTKIEGAGKISHLAGTTVLTGASSAFAGTTNVSGGTLLVKGSLGGTTDVGAGGSLGGSGTLFGPVSVSGTLLGQSGQVLTMNSLVLDSGANIDVTLGAPSGTGLFKVTGNLTLDGTLNVTGVGGFGEGVYRIIDYGGALTDNGMTIGAMPSGTDGIVQTAVANQVNLLVAGALGDTQFWNGTATVADGTIHGGSGVWSAGSNTNWTNANGTAASAWAGKFAVFQNNPGSVTVDAASGGVTTGGMQFIGQGWTVTGDAITLAGDDGATTIRVGDGSAEGASGVATIGSELAGASRLVKDDLGTLILTGSNSYTGGTTIKAGTLQIGNGGTAGAIEGDVIDNANLAFNRSDATTFGGTISGSGTVRLLNGDLTLLGNNSYTGATDIAAGATLRLGNGGAAGSLVGPVLNDGTLAFNRSDDAGFAGAISGSGTLRQIGKGKTELTGDSSTFTGKTFVEKGALAVNGHLGGTVDVLAGGRLQGTGTVGSTIVRGTIAPGNSIGTLNVAGDIGFVAGSTYEVEVNAAGEGDRIVASGSASIGGGTVAVLAGMGNYKPQTDYTILTADGGVTGAFTGVTSNLAFLDPSLLYDAKHVMLRLRRNDIAFSDIGLTPNQVATGGATEKLGWDMPIFDAVANLTAPQAQDAFDQLSGEIHASMRAAMLEDSRFVRHAVWDRLRSTADGDPGGLWGQAIGSWGHIGGNGNAARLDRSTGGFLMGIDRANDTLRFGMVGGYSKTDIDVDARGSSGKIDSFHLAAYAGGEWRAVALRIGLAHSWQNIHTNRNVVFPGFKDITRASYNGRNFQVFGELGYSFDLGHTKIEPYTSLAYVRTRSNAFHETGGDAKLLGNKASAGVAFSALGLRSATTFSLGKTNATFRVGAGWRHAFGNSAPVTIMRYEAGGDSFSIVGLPLTRDAAALDAGLDMAVSGRTTIGLAYSGQVGNGQTDHMVKAGVSIKF